MVSMLSGRSIDEELMSSLEEGWVWTLHAAKGKWTEKDIQEWSEEGDYLRYPLHGMYWTSSQRIEYNIVVPKLKWNAGKRNGSSKRQTFCATFAQWNSLLMPGLIQVKSVTEDLVIQQWQRRYQQCLRSSGRMATLCWLLQDIVICWQCLKEWY